MNITRRIKESLPNTTRAQNLPTTDLPNTTGFFMPYSMKNLLTTKRGVLAIVTVPSHLALDEVDPEKYPLSLIRPHRTKQDTGTMVQFTQILGFTFGRRRNESSALAWITPTKDQTPTPRPGPKLLDFEG